MNVKICSRRAAEELLEQGFPEHTAVISFYDPSSKRNAVQPLDYMDKAERVFPVAIHDLDLTALPEVGLDSETFFPEADNLAAFILQAEKDHLNIICQCEYGQSRSAACAAAIREYFCGDGIQIFADYRYYPNQVVYHKVFDALTEKGKVK